MPSLGEQLRQIAKWSPYLNAVTEIISAGTVEERATAVYTLLKLVAKETSTELDDEAIYHIEAVLRTPEGKELVNYACRLVANLLDSEVDK